jgi:rhamnose utilization protein RhaD (predicted bifunctional aldolase and dehydrogenase)
MEEGLMEKSVVLEELVRMSASLGRPEKDYVILGEGNTSAKIDDDRFYVKSSGAYLSASAPEFFVEVQASKVLDMLDGPELTDAEIKARLGAARVDQTSRWPSIETVFHAYLLTLPGVNFVAHTHPTAVNIILCSNAAQEIIESRIFPDEIVYCGIRPILMPYVDPGVKLARTVKQTVVDFMETEGVTPKVILMRNHGFIALGETAADAEAITAMWVKTARVLAGAYTLGGVHYFSDDNVKRIYTRPDEAMRIKQAKG